MSNQNTSNHTLGIDLDQSNTTTEDRLSGTSMALERASRLPVTGATATPVESPWNHVNLVSFKVATILNLHSQRILMNKTLYLYKAKIMLLSQSLIFAKDLFRIYDAKIWTIWRTKKIVTAKSISLDHISAY